MNSVSILTGLLLLACVVTAFPIFDDPLLDTSEDSSISSSEEDDIWDLGIFKNIFGFFNFDNAKVINSTSQTKVVDGHIVTFNETIYKNDQNAIIKVDKYLIVPVDSNNSTEASLISTSKDREEVTTEVVKPTRKSENTNEIPKIANVELSAKKRTRRENVSYFNTRRNPSWLALLHQKYFPGANLFFLNRRPDDVQPKHMEEMVDYHMPPLLQPLNSNSIDPIPESRESLEDIQESYLPNHIENFPNKEGTGLVSPEFESFDSNWNGIPKPIDLSHDTRVNELMEAQPLRKPHPDVEIFSNSIVNVPYHPNTHVNPPNYISSRYNPRRFNNPRNDLRNYQFNK